MAQLKSFKYLESEQNNEKLASTNQQETTDTQNISEIPSNEQKSSSNVSSRPSISSSSLSSASINTQDTSTVVGGNLKATDNGSQTSLKSQDAEYQSAKLELDDEEDDGSTKDEADTKIATISDNARREQSQESNSSVTKIEIEHPSKQTKGQFKPMVEREISAQQEPTNPLTPRLKLHMPRSQTSPSPLSNLPMGRSPKLQLRGAGGQFASPILIANKRALISSSSSATAVAPDNTSQYSYATQSRQNQFEVRWHNVDLHARPKSRLPTLLTDTMIYKRLFGPSGNDMQDKYSLDQASCYSPPVLHKIPPTIDEGLEMKISLGEETETELKMSNKNLNSPPDKPKQLQQSQFVKNSISRNQPNASINQTIEQIDSASISSSKARCILSNVSGQVFSGQMTAILGPSGVGKTSLLNSLTGRNTLDGTGKVSLIGASDKKRMSVVTVPQMDVLPGKLTTMEDLQFTSRLKNPERRYNHARNIDRIVKHLHMEKFLHTRIDKLSGGEARRLSIARELLNCPDIMILDEPTSGLDANTCKKIITALRDIVEHCDNILDKPMSIIITIHQPQQEVYNIFHRVYVMAVGGRVIYEGSPQLLLPTILEQSSLNRVCPIDQLNENPAIVAIEVASGEYGSQIINELASYHDNQVYEEFVLYNAGVSSSINGGGIGSMDSPLNTPRSLRQAHKSPLSVSRFDMSLHRKRLNSFDSSIGKPTPVLAKRWQGMSQFDRMSSMTSLSYASTYDADLPETTSKLKVDKRLRRSVVMKCDFWGQTMTLIERSWLLTKRDFFLMAIRIIGFLLVAGGTVQIFSHALDPEEHQCPQFESEVDDMYEYIGQIKTRLISLLDMLRQGNSTHLFFFHLLLCITMVTSALTGLVFPLQMRMFIREYKNGWYSPASFIVSQTIAELPADIIGPIITLLITYPLCHQPDSMYHWREFGYAIVLVTCAIICKSQAQIVGAFLMDSVENSVFISCVCVTGPALLSGIPLRIDQMIVPMQWVSYGSFLRYSFESLLALRYGYGMCPCDPDIVNGYPIVASSRAIPPHLESLATGLLALNQPNNLANETDIIESAPTSAALVGESENLFLRFIRLITDASNMFVGGAEIGDCTNYRSLYLIGMNIPKNILNNWIPVMLLMFIISRFLIYFVVKTVIKLRRC